MTTPFVFGNVFNYATNQDVFGNVFQYGTLGPVQPDSGWVSDRRSRLLITFDRSRLLQSETRARLIKSERN